MLADDVRRGFHTVDTFLRQYPAVVDEVTLAGRELHQLLRRLHGLPGRQVTEQAAQDLRDIHLGQQLVSELLIDDERRGHTSLQLNYFVHYGLFVYLDNISGIKKRSQGCVFRRLSVLSDACAALA
ncbi:hypothetical protein D3C80_1367590 [compost metagenome]